MTPKRLLQENIDLMNRLLPVGNILASDKNRYEIEEFETNTSFQGFLHCFEVSIRCNGIKVISEDIYTKYKITKSDRERVYCNLLKLFLIGTIEKYYDQALMLNFIEKKNNQ